MTTTTDVIRELEAAVGAGQVLRDDATRQTYASDQTENPAAPPDVVVKVTTVEQLVAVVKLAARAKIPLTPRVAGTNLGGLAIPSRGGWLLDFTGMNRVVSIHPEDMVAVVEPGVTFGQLKDELDKAGTGLTIGFPLAPPETSVMANCLLDGLGNLSLRHSAMGEWISGLEVVRADGSLLRTGAMALGVPVPFARAPLPDLTGLFVSLQGSTGIVAKAAIQLWPVPKVRERSFMFAFDRKTALRALREMPRLDVLDDLGSLSWPTGKMLLGVERPGPRDPAEPEFFVYLDLGAASEKLMAAKRKVIDDYVRGLRKEGHRIEGPLDVPSLVRLEPRLSKFSEFPTRLDFLLDHPGGGLTWVGTYGPMSRFPVGLERGIEIIERHGFPPMVVARPMKGAHFGVLRFIEVFDKKDADEVARVAAANRELCDALIEEGFIMYKTPAWAVDKYAARLDPGFTRLLREVKALMDPDGLMNPGRWRI